MKKVKFLLLVSVLGAGFSLASCSKSKPKDDNIVSAKGLELSTGQEVASVTSKAAGLMNVSYDKKTHMLTYEITWNSLTGNPVGSHIHGTAKRKVNAPVKHDFTSLIPKSTAGSFSNSFMVDGVAIKEDSLLMGFYYLNIHTPTYPGGEIRGQIEF